MYGMTADQYDAYHLLKLAENGRPEEQMAQFAASMISCGGLTATDTAEFFINVMGRTQDLINDDQIWPNLMAGGNQSLYGPEEILDNIIDLVTNESVKGQVYDLLLDANMLDESADAGTVRVVCCKPHRDDSWLVCSINDQRFGWWDGRLYTQITNPSDTELSPSDVIEVENSDVNWLDAESIARDGWHRSTT